MCGNVCVFVCMCGYGSQLGVPSSPCSNVQIELVSVVFCKDIIIL